MSALVWLHAEWLWWALVLVPGLALGAARLGALGPWRRWGALLLEALGAGLLLAALAEPARAIPDTGLNLVLVLDTSASLSLAARQQTLSYAQATLAAAPAGTHIRLVATAAEARLLEPADLSPALWPASTVVSGTSDLAAGLRLAGSTLPATGQRRVVLLSDGWETRGQAGPEAAGLRARGVDVQVVELAALGNPEVLVAGVTAPAYTRVGDLLPLQVRVVSTGATTATLQVQVDGVLLTRRTVTLAAGETAISLESKAETPGFHQVDALIETAADTIAANNRAGAAVVVKPAPRVLILEDRPGEATPLATALRGQQMTVDVRSPGLIPTQYTALGAYDSVILNNVAATSLTLDQQRTLQEYVRRGGRGLVVVGGPTSYARGGYADSVFEQMLPVSSNPPAQPEKGPTALILILDRSGSMDQRSSEAEGVTKMDMARAAAQLAVDSLRPGDSIGVLSFATLDEWTVPIQTVGDDADKARLKDAIAGITYGGGTAIYPAVQDALEGLRAVTAPTRHLVLLTDGQELTARDYGPLLDDLRRANITLSTIGIGDDADKDLLTRLAKAGNGRYYFTERISTLPRIVFKEVDVALKAAVREGLVQPQVLAPSPVLRGLAPQDLPALTAYAVTEAKPEAVVGLAGEGTDPLLAHWNYGLGRVVAFTSGSDPAWAGDWATWAAGPRFWSQAVRWSMASPVNPELQPAITTGPPTDPAQAAVAHLVVESLRADHSFADLATVGAAVRGPGGVVTSTLLEQTAPGRYEADLPLAVPGAYEVRITRQDGTTTVAETAGVSVPPAGELLHPGTNDRLLATVAGGAAPLTSAQEALDPQKLPGATPQYVPIWGWLVPPGLLALLAGVAVRRVAAPRWRC